MRSLIFAIIAVVATSFMMPAVHAQTAESERQKLVVEMFEIMGYEQIIIRLSETVAKQVSAQIKRKAPTASDKLLAKVGTIYGEEFAAMRPELMLFAGNFLSKNFTIDELKQLMTFYKTPVGQKGIKIMPQMTQEMMAWMPSVMVRFQGRALRRIHALAKEEGLEL